MDDSWIRKETGRRTMGQFMPGTNMQWKIEQHRTKGNTIIYVAFKLLYSRHICGNVHFLWYLDFSFPCTLDLGSKKSTERTFAPVELSFCGTFAPREVKSPRTFVPWNLRTRVIFAVCVNRPPATGGPVVIQLSTDWPPGTVVGYPAPTTHRMSGGCRLVLVKWLPWWDL